MDAGGGKVAVKKGPPSLKYATHALKMKLGAVISCLKKIQNIYKSRDIPLAFCWHQHFLTELCIFWFIKKYRHRLYFGTIPNYESLKIVIISMVTTLMMSAKMATLGYSKI